MASGLALRRDVKQALAAVVRALLLQHVALVDQLLEHAAERLLGDVQDVEQVGDLHARVAVDEMQHPVVGAAEAELEQHLVRVADEIAIGKKQELDDVPDRLAAPPRDRGDPLGRLVPGARPWRSKFMSAMLTYFGFMLPKQCARRKDRTERPFPVRGVLVGPDGPDRPNSYRELP